MRTAIKLGGVLVVLCQHSRLFPYPHSAAVQSQRPGRMTCCTDRVRRVPCTPSGALQSLGHTGIPITASLPTTWLTVTFSGLLFPLFSEKLTCVSPSEEVEEEECEERLVLYMF